MLYKGLKCSDLLLEDDSGHLRPAWLLHRYNNILPSAINTSDITFCMQADCYLIENKPRFIVKITSTLD